MNNSVKKPETAKKRIAQALMAQGRYGDTLTKKPGIRRKPKMKVRPKGNPLKGTYGFKAEIDF